ncbi:MAG TPA: hypothetical protein ENK31_01090 [Nannocystis exedens]|nr:hypothetical protein [Nannocystis exedens]
MLVGLGGCSIQPGHYVIIRLASAKTTESASCWDNMVPDSIKDDTTTLATGSSVAIFAADADTYYLELADGTISIEGTRDGKDYSFFGEDIDVEEYSTTTVTWDVQTTINNKSVTGKSITTTTCTGDGCGIASCVQTTEFVGTVVKGVELQRGI